MAASFRAIALAEKGIAIEQAKSRLMRQGQAQRGPRQPSRWERGTRSYRSPATTLSAHQSFPKSQTVQPLAPRSNNATRTYCKLSSCPYCYQLATDRISRSIIYACVYDVDMSMQLVTMEREQFGLLSWESVVEESRDS